MSLQDTSPSAFGQSGSSRDEAFLHTIDLDGRVLHVGQTPPAITGLTVDDVRGCLITDFIHPDDHEEWTHQFSRILADGDNERVPSSTLQLVYRIRCSDGKYVAMEALGRLIHLSDGTESVLGSASVVIVSATQCPYGPTTDLSTNSSRPSFTSEQVRADAAPTEGLVDGFHNYAAAAQPPFLSPEELLTVEPSPTSAMYPHDTVDGSIAQLGQVAGQHSSDRIETQADLSPTRRKGKSRASDNTPVDGTPSGEGHPTSPANPALHVKPTGRRASMRADGTAPLVTPPDLDQLYREHKHFAFSLWGQPPGFRTLSRRSHSGSPTVASSSGDLSAHHRARSQATSRRSDEAYLSSTSFNSGGTPSSEGSAAASTTAVAVAAAEPNLNFRTFNRVPLPHELRCLACGTTSSPEWRRGPNGPKTLCNACGLRWVKQTKRRSSDE